MTTTFTPTGILISIAIFFWVNTAAQNPFDKFKGNWKLKGGKWEYSENGKYQSSVDSSIFSNAELIPDNGIEWTYDLQGGSFGKILWTYNKSERKAYWLSENANGPMGHGESIEMAADSIVFKNFFDGVKGYRKYVFRLNSKNELFMRASFFENDKPTGNFYGGTWVKE